MLKRLSLKNKMILALIVVVMITVLFPFESIAQCPACRAAVESSMKETQNKAVGTGLNKGIMLLLSAPYVLIGGLLIVWRKNSKRADERES